MRIFWLFLLALAACSGPTAIKMERPVWEPVWVALPDGREAQLMGRVIPGDPEHLLVEGDILVPRRPVSRPEGVASQALVHEPFSWGALWPGGVVPYAIDPGVSEAQRERIRQAIAHLHENTPIRFVERSSEADYVRFISDGRPQSCWSRIGRVGGAQDLDVYCGQDGVPPMGTVVHEILHALGFWHEQSRADRDEYVEIVWENIQDDFRSEFKKIGTHGRLQGPYDYDSIMHYPARAFSKNGQPTIRPKNGVPPERLGQRQGLSAGDIAAIRAYYSTPLLRLDGGLHQTTFATAYPLNQTLRNVGAVALRLARVEVGGGWLAGAILPANPELPPGQSVQLSLQAKACPGPGLQTDTLRIELEGGGAYTLARTRACYRNQPPRQMTLLRLDPAGSETLQLTFAEWSWAKRYRLEAQVGGQAIGLPYAEIQTDRPQPLYTTLLRLEGRRGQEVCLTLTPLDSTLSEPTPARACAAVP
ncbi:MAG: M12 family metallopeptidase [Meiothermus sp.]|uniref:M12 family metallopeptidase n=1 Tax=Meiothermus sp. TaxID=1955249 RepID=UPI00298F1EB1|nr:M12 family metallopeptidase [Meiothermus sp.]MDW8091805.1 M12 family metallopeptidase [Meiothermus sp.]